MNPLMHQLFGLMLSLMQGREERGEGGKCAWKVHCREAQAANEASYDELGICMGAVLELHGNGSGMGVIWELCSSCMGVVWELREVHGSCMGAVWELGSVAWVLLGSCWGVAWVLCESCMGMALTWEMLFGSIVGLVWQ